MTTFTQILTKYRQNSYSERDKGDRFERLMQAYLQTDPRYAYRFKNVWMWADFPFRADFGGNDTGIDLVALEESGEYWAIQCKCFQETATIDKPAVDSFLATSSRHFKDAAGSKLGFSYRLWISTTNHWNSNATEAIQNQSPPVVRINLYELMEAPVDWEKLDQGTTGELSRTARKSLRPHQKTALDNTHEYFKAADRGKLIMACGTGKTFTSLRIAEHETNGKGLILFLVPSIALLGQALAEWSAEAQEPINPICICSDSGVSRKKAKNEDSDGFSVLDLALPASTNIKNILRQFEFYRNNPNGGMTVVFSTYQSIDVIAEAQRTWNSQHGTSGFGTFDLIICDEAHRTTGVTLAESDESAFVKVHNNDFIRSKKRIYMTATPRLFSDDSKSRAAQAEAVLCSMDDPAVYGEEIYRIGFGEAVEKNLLTDYKVLVLALNEKDIPAAVQKIITSKESEINTDDVSKLIGCINALSKQIIGDEGILKDSDPEPMRRAVAFCQNIKVSQKITTTFNVAADVYVDSLDTVQREKTVSVASKHIDGGMSATQRDELMMWLKEPNEGRNECRVLTNVRCLSEGVDVPSLDAVLFLSARNSQVDVVQSVGRVMRTSPGKKYGYIIIPVVIPADVEPERALDDNDRYRVVWTVLNALRAHDDRFNATVNKIELNKKRPSQILVGRPAGLAWNEETVGAKYGGESEETYRRELNNQLSIQFEQLQNVVFAKMVQKVGDKRYWEQWAKDVAIIAERQIERITYLIQSQKEERAAFDEFLSGLQKNINPGITEAQAIDMLAQHIITQPIFEALFEGYSFVKNNAVSMAMQGVLDVLDKGHIIAEESETLQKFYDSVRNRAKDIDNAEGKQRIIIELYDKFFKAAFPKMVEQLGIVYTPVEVVDFIVHSVNDVLINEFGRSISDENIHVLDPFTGTGTFITRLLQSGLIESKDLERKYLNELHANEIVLLAYYIAAVNIENAYHDQTPDTEDGIGKEKYTPFEGIVLTDTFQLGETEDGERLFSDMFPKNSERVQRQKKAPLRVIIGNPPYSIAQNSSNDNAQNQSYPKLDNRIFESYSELSTASLNRSLYDPYIKAFRWSTDRLDKSGGIICFVSNGGWLDGNSTVGFRKSIEQEFTSIYVFNLRGNQRTSGELSRKEGGKIFGSGSRTPISITLLVKNPDLKTDKATIHYHDIGDYLDREEKLKIVKSYKTFANPVFALKTLQPNEHGDWLSMRNAAFENFISLNPDKNLDLKTKSFFVTQNPGLLSGREPWVYNYKKEYLIYNMSKMISFYESQRQCYIKESAFRKVAVNDFLDGNQKNISWTVNLKKDIERNKFYQFSDNYIQTSIYRPFTKQLLYFHKPFIERPGGSNLFFPKPILNNLVICVSGIGANKENCTYISNTLIDYNALDAGAKCFPLYYYEENNSFQKGMFDSGDSGNYVRRDAISDFILDMAQKQYGKNITKEDIFYYVYGFLHSKEYRETFANDLKKMLPRLPLVEGVADFWAFSKAGRALADLHLNYEAVPAYPDVNVTGAETGHFKVEKMRFPKKGEKGTILYNSAITIENIPEKAYEYVVNGKSAIEWIMDRYQITVHKESGIKNDPNDWSEEVGNPRYILDLLLSIINVSVQTVDIVEGLPKVKFE